MWVERNGRTWRIRDLIAGHKVDLVTGFPTKSSAVNYMTQLRADQIRGEALVPRGGQMTLDAFVDEWWPHYEKSLKPTARHSEGGRVRNHIRPLLGPLALDDVTTLAVQQWVSDLEAGAGPMGSDCRRKRIPLAAKTIHNCHGLLFTIMSAAVVAKLVRVNPCAATILPRREPKEMRCLTDPEIARLRAHVPTRWLPLVLLLLSTGLRWGEAVGLRVGRVDLLARQPRLTVVEHLHELSTGEIVFTDPKSRRSRRTVSFPKDVALALVPLVAGKASDDLVFTAARGGPVRTRNFRRDWLTWVAAAGLEGLRVHDLRHTHAGILFSAHNLSLPAISRRMGHSSIAVTDQLYGHLREEADPGILSAIEAALSMGDVTAEVDDELAEDRI